MTTHAHALLVDAGGRLGDALERRLGELAATVTRLPIEHAVHAELEPVPSWLCVAAIGCGLDAAAQIEQIYARVGAAMAANGGGAVVAITSTASLAGDPSDPGDGALAGAVIALTQSLAACEGRHGVRANVVAADRAIVADRRPPSAALPHAGSAEDIADAVAFLASDDAAFVTAVVLRVDGGRSTRLPHTAGNPPVPIPQEQP